MASIKSRIITAFTNLIAALDRKPNATSGMTAAQLQAYFDSSPEELRLALKGLIEDLQSTSGSANIGSETIGILKVDLTGTVEKTAGSKNVVGTATNFTTELLVGQTITIPGTSNEARVIDTITDDTHLAVTANFSNSATGQTAYKANDIYSQLSALVAAGSGSIPADGSISNTKLATDIKVGSLAALTTSIKSSIVAAINELVSSISTDVGNLSTHISDTTKHTDVMTTEGDMIGRNGTIPVRIAKGTARQQLAMNSGATGQEWVASLQSLLTTQGDIIQASASNTPARLALGTMLQKLKVNSAATGLEYTKFDNVIVPSDTILMEALTQRGATTNGYILVKSFTVGLPGKYRITYDLIGAVGPYQCNSKITVNDVDTSLGRTNTQSTWESYTSDLITQIDAGSAIKIYIGSSNAGVTVYIRNVRICGTISSFADSIDQD